MVDSYIRLLKSNNLNIKNSIIRSNFSKSKIKKITVKDTKFLQKKTSNIAHVTADYLYIKDSILNTDFYKSRIKRVVLENVTGYGADFYGLEGERFSISNSSISNLGLGGTPNSLLKVESINSSYSSLLRFIGKGFDQIDISGCKDETELCVFSTTINKINISNCLLTRFTKFDSRINTFTIKDSHVNITDLSNGIWRRMVIKDYLIDNVFIDGRFDIKKVRIDALKTNRFRKGPHSHITIEDANFDFNSTTIP